MSLNVLTVKLGFFRGERFWNCPRGQKIGGTLNVHVCPLVVKKGQNLVHVVIECPQIRVMRGTLCIPFFINNEL